eukprot:CAMPEP_0118710924 /NCGR_PEP_ID=MMETSP0800-20121206/23718_1 /TAXON_ID=210618 ORGANISM="Striatella unipunctata, Strain CCMP2910" /NCGR_SAMPLE_ID=MMETSP0800 /ASSEMBLY_ACC=CAM_ASM_000638 /LENGTH=242 /DNA_ID=CAMNT_0006615293 /DNA_START=65 /DNA_END=793 /DNA_ORIENTATION=+
MEANKMDRGSDAMKTHLSSVPKIQVRQTRRGWLQECIGCEAKSEFKYFIEGNQFADSLEDSDCCIRLFCSPCHPFKMMVKDTASTAEILTMDRPFACPVGNCKCCCYQAMSFSSGGSELGSIKEDCYYCVPQFTMFDHSGNEVYIVHPPTCCGGVCYNCCAEGKNCFAVCCKVPFHVFPASQKGSTDGGAQHAGKIVKLPKSLMTEILTEANAFDVEFPTSASADQKAMLTGTAIFLNANFF